MGAPGPLLPARRGLATAPPVQRVTFPVLPSACVGMFLIMFTLKLTGPMATASWWVVTAPLWAPGLLIAVLILLTLVLTGIDTVLAARRRAKARTAARR